MEGIGAAEIIILNRAELRDTLISEQSSDRARVGRAGSRLWARGIGLVRLIAAGAYWRRTADASAGLASLGAQCRCRRCTNPC
jgi:hypothetical protein